MRSQAVLQSMVRLRPGARVSGVDFLGHTVSSRSRCPDGAHHVVGARAGRSRGSDDGAGSRGNSREQGGQGGGWYLEEPRPDWGVTWESVLPQPPQRPSQQQRHPHHPVFGSIIQMVDNMVVPGSDDGHGQERGAKLVVLSPSAAHPQLLLPSSRRGSSMEVHRVARHPSSVRSSFISASGVTAETFDVGETRPAQREAMMAPLEKVSEIVPDDDGYVHVHGRGKPSSASSASASMSPRLTAAAGHGLMVSPRSSSGGGAVAPLARTSSF